MSKQNRYFEKFPLIDYNGTPAIDITKRVAFNEQVRNYISAFYEYTLTNDDRIENLAFNYYNDVDYDWIIYHSNRILDPYYQVPIHYENFDDFIKSKYGSIANAKRKTIYYVTNYDGDDTILSTAAYNALPGERKKYWQPVLSISGIAGYERSKEDLIATTNRIISFQFETTSGLLEVGEIIESISNTEMRAEIVSLFENEAIIQHVTGSFSNTMPQVLADIRGLNSNATATMNVSTVKTLSNVIHPLEEVYYRPLSYYEYEENLNNARRNIRLVDSSYVKKLNKQLTDMLK